MTKKESTARVYLKQFTLEHMIEESKKLDRKFIVHCGPTNSGKTYDSLQALKTAQTGVYLGPLRLLALEVFDSLNADGCRCSLLTGEERMDVDGAGITASTIEMCDFRKSYDIAVIDEAQMLGDYSRGGAWLKAILLVNAKEVHICTAPEGLNLILKLIQQTEAPCC